MKKLLLFLFLQASSILFSQSNQVFTHADSVKGTYGPARSWWDALHYDLHVSFNLKDSSVSGHNEITYKVLREPGEMQIDLMRPLIIDAVKADGKPCAVRRDGNAHYITLPEPQEISSVHKLFVAYHGKPVQAKNPPWDGGMVWTRDSKNSPWISVACQGMAAQAWFPNKDHMKDEPDSADMHFTVPSDLFVVSNGRFADVMPAEGNQVTYHWRVRNPINNYNIIPYLGKYTVLKDTFNGRGGVLDVEFWVLPQSYEAARAQFAQVKPMLRCFEHWFGKYPFYEDGYKLVEAPYLGMEHQSGIAYGNGFVNGYKGRDLSNTGWGLKWDFIVVHESGHEWFGNNITASDVADNWIHESFTAYSENLFTEWLFGKEAGAEYVRGTRAAVLNDKPIIAPYNVNAGGSLDLYYKGANMLHTIRQIVSDDKRWLSVLSGMNREFWHKTVGTREIEQFMSKQLELDLNKVFDQYLRTTNIPVLEYRIRKNKLRYRWRNCVKGFDMPVIVNTAGGPLSLKPSAKWRRQAVTGDSLAVHPDYYVTLRKSGR